MKNLTELIQYLNVIINMKPRNLTTAFCEAILNHVTTTALTREQFEVTIDAHLAQCDSNTLEFSGILRDLKIIIKK